MNNGEFWQSIHNGPSIVYRRCVRYLFIFYKKKPIKPFLFVDICRNRFCIFSTKNKRVQKGTYVPIVFVINNVWQNGNPLIKYSGVIRFRHVLSFFLFFFFQETRSWVECASLLWLSNGCFRLSSSVKKKMARDYCKRHSVLNTCCDVIKGFYNFLLNSLSLNWIIKKIQLIFQRTPFVDILLNVDKLSDDKKKYSIVASFHNFILIKLIF